jgi:hypothetical protein
LEWMRTPWYCGSHRDPNKIYERKFDPPWRSNGFRDDLLDDESTIRTTRVSFYGNNKI